MRQTRWVPCCVCLPPSRCNCCGMRCNNMPLFCFFYRLQPGWHFSCRTLPTKHCWNWLLPVAVAFYCGRNWTSLPPRCVPGWPGGKAICWAFCRYIAAYWRLAGSGTPERLQTAFCSRCCVLSHRRSLSGCSRCCAATLPSAWPAASAPAKACPRAAP